MVVVNTASEARKSAAEQHLLDARRIAARTDLEFVEMAITNAHRGAGRLYVFVNEYESESEYIAGRLTDAEGAEIDPDAGEIAVYSMEVGEDETGKPISVPVTVADLVQQALRTFPGDIETELLQSENEDAALSGFFFLPLPLPLHDGS